jgi:hypothetical protein
MTPRRKLLARAGTRGAVQNAARALAAPLEGERAVDRLVVRLRDARANAVLSLVERLGGVSLPVWGSGEPVGDADQEHVVGFYDDDDVLVDSVMAFVLPALRAGEPVVVVATGAHRTRVRSAASAAGIDVAAAEGSGALLCLDAAATVAELLVDGMPDPDRFRAVLGGILSAEPRRGRHVCVFGEMVAVLWERGDVAAAIELEGLWNELARSEPISLLCGYPVGVFDDGDRQHIQAMCAEHSALHLHPEVPPVQMPRA